MKRAPSNKRAKPDRDELEREYRFDYRKSRANRFAARYAAGSRVIVLDADVAQVFTTRESVNAVLRALMETMPPKRIKTRRP
jgi:hypothetical protein